MGKGRHRQTYRSQLRQDAIRRKPPDDYYGVFDHGMTVLSSPNRREIPRTQSRHECKGGPPGRTSLDDQHSWAPRRFAGVPWWNTNLQPLLALTQSELRLAACKGS